MVDPGFEFRAGESPHLKKRRPVSDARVRALYPNRDWNGDGDNSKGLEPRVVGRESLESVAMKRNSLESAAVETNTRGSVKRNVKRARISREDRVKIYDIANQNLEAQKRVGHSYIRWESVMGTLSSELPHLQEFSVDQIRSAYTYEKSWQTGDGVRRETRPSFSSEVCEAVYGIAIRCVDPANNTRIKRGSWSKIVGDVYEGIPSLEGFSLNNIQTIFYKEQDRRRKLE